MTRDDIRDIVIMDVMPMYSRLDCMLNQKLDKSDAEFNEVVRWMREFKPMLDMLVDTVYELQRKVQEQRQLITQVTWSSLIDKAGESD